MPRPGVPAPLNNNKKRSISLPTTTILIPTSRALLALAGAPCGKWKSSELQRIAVSKPRRTRRSTRSLTPVSCSAFFTPLSSRLRTPVRLSKDLYGGAAAIYWRGPFLSSLECALKHAGSSPLPRHRKSSALRLLSNYHNPASFTRRVKPVFSAEAYGNPSRSLSLSLSRAHTLYASAAGTSSGKPCRCGS